MKRFFLPLLLFFISLILIGEVVISQNTKSTEPLPVDQAFSFSAAARDYQTVLATWEIAPSYFLYRDRIHFSPVKSKSAQLGQPLKPLGCSDKGFCYPPTSKIVSIDLAGNYMRPVRGIDVGMPTPTKVATTKPATHDEVKKLLTGKNLIALIFGFFGFGILISLTPCVLPMIPILSGIIFGHGKITTSRSFCLSLFYVLGMAITYAVAGLLFGMLGSTVQALFQQPWIIALFSMIFVALALSLFGFYELQLPQRWRKQLAEMSEHQKRGSYLGVNLMGVLTGNALLGGVALFSMGIGMGAPLLILGAFGPKLLPKTGTWMNATNNIMGILLLAVAIWMLSRVIPSSISMLLWAALAIGSAVYMGALSSVQTGWQKVSKALGLLLFVYGILLVVGAAIGNSNPLRPLNFTTLSK